MLHAFLAEDKVGFPFIITKVTQAVNRLRFFFMFQDFFFTSHLHSIEQTEAGEDIKSRTTKVHL